MSRSRKPVNPTAQSGLDRLKAETAAELGLKDYQNTYKGALTSADNGRVGGQMVRKMIAAQEQQFGGNQNQLGGNQNQNQNQNQSGKTLTEKYDIKGN